jgi:hypothetical protein
MTFLERNKVVLIQKWMREIIKSTLKITIILAVFLYVICFAIQKWFGVWIPDYWAGEKIILEFKCKTEDRLETHIIFTQLLNGSGYGQCLNYSNDENTWYSIVFGIENEKIKHPSVVFIKTCRDFALFDENKFIVYFKWDSTMQSYRRCSQLNGRPLDDCLPQKRNVPPTRIGKRCDVGDIP